ncbi:carboxypeptidase-like regulatory domain-containing protein [Hymenobacter sp. CRA2]|uniref:carboxypeptidase-like regulatory domain-containing protein n=1 Tax=Hymenobacter sp. CRA2 TaxID=1955620 RepID=UPI00098FB3BC|nr:carboxypeptidase-like regulatory domain-containing protein [Hymenobacter sp. CRA2]OON68219.1 hypothetical protein B0919_13760 [Hymenobacter sp. CRA2]
MRTIFFSSLLLGCLLGATAAYSQSSLPTKPATEATEPQVIRGQVLTEDGQPLPGATVLLKGTKQVYSTNSDGQYAFASALPTQAVQISLLGYADVDATVRPDVTNSTILQMLPGTRVKKGKLIAVGRETAQ